MLQSFIVHGGHVCAPQLGRRLIAETAPLPDVPDGPFLMKQEALPSMTGMIPVPLQGRVGVPASSDGDLRPSGSSSQGARHRRPDPCPFRCSVPSTRRPLLETWWPASQTALPRESVFLTVAVLKCGTTAWTDMEEACACHKRNSHALSLLRD